MPVVLVSSSTVVDVSYWIEFAAWRRRRQRSGYTTVRMGQENPNTRKRIPCTHFVNIYRHIPCFQRKEAHLDRIRGSHARHLEHPSVLRRQQMGTETMVTTLVPVRTSPVQPSSIAGCVTDGEIPSSKGIQERVYTRRMRSSPQAYNTIFGHCTVRTLAMYIPGIYLQAIAIRKEREDLLKQNAKNVLPQSTRRVLARHI